MGNQCYDAAVLSIFWRDFCFSSTLLRIDASRRLIDSALRLFYTAFLNFESFLRGDLSQKYVIPAPKNSACEICSYVRTYGSFQNQHMLCCWFRYRSSVRNSPQLRAAIIRGCVLYLLSLSDRLIVLELFGTRTSIFLQVIGSQVPVVFFCFVVFRTVHPSGGHR